MGYGILFIVIVVFVFLLKTTRRYEPTQVTNETATKDTRTAEEILAGRSYEEVYRELDDKEYDELSRVETELLYNLTKYFEAGHK